MSSLREAYYLAHTAQCRLQLEASRPDRNLRFVVGHLMHYESLRLRIVEIEHDISRSQRAKAVQFRGTGHVDGASQQGARRTPSTGQLRRRSPPPPAAASNWDEDGEEEEGEGDGEGDGEEEQEEQEEQEERDAEFNDDDADEGLGLTRFPSRSSRPQPPPDLEPDDADDDEPVSPEQPDQATLEQALKGDSNELLAQMYEGVRRCRCHGHTGTAPPVERMWALPGSGKDGVTRAVAQMVE